MVMMVMLRLLNSGFENKVVLDEWMGRRRKGKGAMRFTDIVQ